MARTSFPQLSSLALLTLLCGIVPAATAGGQRERADESSELVVIATTTIVADLVRQIGAPHVSVSALIGAGVDPHTYQPAPRDLTRIPGAALVAANGAGLEEGLRALIDNAGPQRFVQLSDSLRLRTLASGHQHDHGEDIDEDHDHDATEGEDEGQAIDPHFWMDPTLIAHAVSRFAETLATIDDEHAAEYRQNAERLRTELLELDRWAESRLATIPSERRLLLTDHDTLGYFADRYGFDQLPAVVPGFSTAGESSARSLAALRDEVRVRRVPAVFVTGGVEATSEMLGADLGIAVVPLPIESIATSGSGAGASTYQELFANAVEIVVAALAAIPDS